MRRTNCCDSLVCGLALSLLTTGVVACRVFLVFLGTSVIVVAFVLVVVGLATSAYVGWTGGTDFFSFWFIWEFCIDS